MLENTSIANSDVIYSEVRDYVTGETFELRQELSTKPVYTYPLPPDLSRYYLPQYRRYVPVVIHILKTLYRLRVRSWLNKFKTPGVALEIGCGDGFMLNALRSYGWKVVGTEQNAQIASYATRELELPVFVGPIDAIAAGPQFDLIILYQVLEHLENPIETLSLLSNRLTPRGRIIIGVPNFASWQSRFSRESWFHLDVPRHLTHFTPKTLENALNTEGLSVDKISYISMEHDPYGWVQSVLNRLGFEHNHLTRLLMRMDTIKPKDAFELTVAAILSPLSLVFSLLSWLAGAGAIMQVEAVRTQDQ